MKSRTMLKRLRIDTIKETRSFYGADAAAVYQSIKDANMHGLVLSEPVYLDDTNEEVMFNINQIVDVVAVPYVEIDEVVPE